MLSSAAEHKPFSKRKQLKPGAEFKTFAHYSRASYIIKDKWNCEPNCLLPETADTVLDYTWRSKSPASAGYIGHNDSTRVIVVVFRGTADTDDWVQDSEFSLDPWPPQIPGSMVHHGFLTAYQSVSGKVTKMVINLARRYPDYKLVFTGHSLGGAETVMCAVDVLQQVPELKKRVHIYTYGMPRIGNDAWADGIDKMELPVYRVVYENDLVPHIPFQWLGYKHFAQEVWIHNNQTVFCGKDSESAQCSASVAFADYSVPDHSRYTQADWKFIIK
ncbi:hypothetical protein GGI04_001421 [Coemansia thaxteri]|nr:hypothetical protein GGI04_001421 [Coemansia thaxteri]KAJ2472833.1 hypothetical protein GGI02_001313 [Coemansia sp. RSA 2322]KAJ2485017.1 hypothetical protein EV174_002003 [Coemansia sp. RSA 2320]